MPLDSASSEQSNESSSNKGRQRLAYLGQIRHKGNVSINLLQIACPTGAALPSWQQAASIHQLADLEAVQRLPIGSGIFVFPPEVTTLSCPIFLLALPLLVKL